MANENNASIDLQNQDLRHIGGLHEQADDASHPDPDEMHRELARIHVEGIKEHNTGHGTTMQHSPARNSNSNTQRPVRSENAHVAESAQNNRHLLSRSISGPQIQRWNAEEISAQPWNHLRSDTGAANDGHGKN